MTIIKVASFYPFFSVFLNELGFTTTPNLKVRCHYCAEENLQFIDVDPAEKVKRYTDSISSFYSNFTYNKTLKGLKAANPESKLEEGLRSPEFHPINPPNFYQTAEKPLEEIPNPENNVFFYSDGFKRARILPKLSENLYIYSEDQANYQSLSKFARMKKINSISENSKQNNEEQPPRFHSNSKMDPRNISESAEFRHEDESLNDRELGELEPGEVLEEKNENDPENGFNGENAENELNGENVVDDDNENQEHQPNLMGSLKETGEVKGKWAGIKPDFGETV